MHCEWGERCGAVPRRRSTGKGLCAPARLPVLANADEPGACVPGDVPCPEGQACQPTRGEFFGFACQPAGARATGAACDGEAEQCGSGDLCVYLSGEIGRWGNERVPTYRIEWFRYPPQPVVCRRFCGPDLSPCAEGQACGRLRDPSQRDEIFPRMGVCRDSPVP